MTSRSLLEPSSEPVLGDAASWIVETLFGQLAVMLCVIAVAFIGLAMLTGRLPVRRGIRVVLGCFLLLGAPVVAQALAGMAEEGVRSSPTLYEPSAPGRDDLPPAEYDPYAGASLRRD